MPLTCTYLLARLMKVNEVRGALLPGCCQVATGGSIEAMPRPPTGKRVLAADGTLTVRGKTGNGEGSVYALGDGTGWKATYYDPAGKLRSVRSRTRAQVLKRRAEAQLAAAASKTSALAESTTVAELARWWLTNVAAVRVRPSTAGQYRVLVARIEGGPLAGLRLAELRVEHVVEWLATLTASGLSPSSVTNTRQCLRQVLDEAVTLGVQQRTQCSRPGGRRLSGHRNGCCPY